MTGRYIIVPTLVPPALVKKQEISELISQIFSWISERVDIWNINEYQRDFLL